MRKILPLFMALIGLGVGLGLGIALQPVPEPQADDTPEGMVSSDENGPHGTAATTASPQPPHDFVKLNNQFIVPIIETGRVTSLVILTLTLEVGLGKTEDVYKLEPKLRDAFLKILFDHANAGGFRGNFTEAGTLNILRAALLETARKLLGPDVHDVLIVDLVRQDG